MTSSHSKHRHKHSSLQHRRWQLFTGLDSERPTRSAAYLSAVVGGSGERQLCSSQTLAWSSRKKGRMYGKCCRTNTTRTAVCFVFLLLQERNRHWYATPLKLPLGVGRLSHFFPHVCRSSTCSFRSAMGEITEPSSPYCLGSGESISHNHVEGALATGAARPSISVPSYCALLQPDLLSGGQKRGTIFRFSPECTVTTGVDSSGRNVQDLGETRKKQFFFANEVVAKAVSDMSLTGAAPPTMEPCGTAARGDVSNTLARHYSDIVGCKENKQRSPSFTRRCESNCELPPWLSMYFDNHRGGNENSVLSVVDVKITDIQSRVTKLIELMDVYLVRSERSAVINTLTSAFGDIFEGSGDSSPSRLSRVLACVDFLLLLVKYMEMGHVALCAAVWHIKTCLDARNALAMVSSLSSCDHEKQASGGRKSSDEYYQQLKSLYLPLVKQNGITSIVMGVDGEDTETPLNNDGNSQEKKIVKGLHKRHKQGHFLERGREMINDISCGRVDGRDQEMRRANMIARQASRLKLTEMIAQHVLWSYQSRNQDIGTGMADRRKVERLQNLLLSVNSNGDWRALALRTAACLFRLRGLLSPSSVREAKGASTKLYREEGRRALYLYAPLAHRMGLHRLKQELERAAFCLLYRRQYEAVMKLYDGDGSSNVDSRSRKSTSERYHVGKRIRDEEGRYVNSSEMCTVSQSLISILDDLTRRIKRILQEDDVFMDQIASVSVTARVKEPYSLWLKMLKIRRNRALKRRSSVERSYDISNGRRNENFTSGMADSVELNGISGSSSGMNGVYEGRLSIFDIPDAMALRVILRARKLYRDERDHITQDRERELCYYVLRLCAERFPAYEHDDNSGCLKPERTFKDYVMQPKRNGYQSLHYRSKTRWRGKCWPFEIQIRSTEMHRVAEYGLAAHWDYKTQHNASGTLRNRRSDASTRKQTVLEKQSCASADADNCKLFSSLSSPRAGQSTIDHHCGDFAYAKMAATHLSNRDYVSKPEFEFHKNIDDIETIIRQDRKRERLQRLAPYLEALTTRGTDLAREQVFVFLATNDETTCLKRRNVNMDYGNKGTILSLAKDAKVVDALHESGQESMQQGRCFFRDDLIVHRNGLKVNLTERIYSGDILTVYSGSKECNCGRCVSFCNK